MHTKLYNLILLISITASSPLNKSNTYKNDLELYNFSGKVKKVTKRSYKKSFEIAGGVQYFDYRDYHMIDEVGKFQKRYNIDYSIEFNKIGYKTIERVYRFNHKKEKSVRTKTIFQYDTDNKLQIEKDFHGEVKKTSKVRKMNYNSEGLLESTTERLYEDIINLYKYKYDKNKNRIVEEVIIDGKLKDLITFKYDDYGNLISIEKTNKRKPKKLGTCDFGMYYKFNKNREILEKVEKDNWRKQSHKYVYEYDDYGNVIKKTYTYIDDTIPRETYTLTNVYKYDSENNWTNKIIRIEGKDCYEVRREFEYY